MKRTRESAKESDEAKRQTTLSSFIIKPRIPACFYLDYSREENTFRALFCEWGYGPDERQGFQAKIYWSGNEISIALCTNMCNGSFEDQDEWHDKCNAMSSSIKDDTKRQHFEDLELQFFDSLNTQDVDAAKASAAAMACFERDWSGSPVNGLRRFLQILTSLGPDERDSGGLNYSVLVWLQCAEAKGFMINSACLDYLISYTVSACYGHCHTKYPFLGTLVSKTKVEIKPTLNRILLLQNRNMELRDLLLAMYIRSEYLSSRQG
ncbi:unnamed protein product [Umbelopsis sp. WA50703]